MQIVNPKMNDILKTPITSKRRFLSWWLVNLPVGFILYFLSIVLFHEFYRIGIVADPYEIQRYYFGDEGMIGHGGWKFVSAAAYSFSTVVGAFLYLFAATGFLIAYIKRSKLLVGLAISFLVMSYFVEVLLNLWFKYKYGPG
jgi:hypothetical protein